jgi:CBS domain-containing protein
MSEQNIGAVLVLESGKPVGIMSERDYARKVILQGKASKEIPVREIMSTNILYVRPEHSIEDCMALMVNKRVRHLPVMRGDKLTGILSIGDVVNAIIGEKQDIIEQLENYIAGRHYTPGKRK